ASRAVGQHANLSAARGAPPRPKPFTLSSQIKAARPATAVSTTRFVSFAMVPARRSLDRPCQHHVSTDARVAVGASSRHPSWLPGIKAAFSGFYVFVAAFFHFADSLISLQHINDCHWVQANRRDLTFTP